MRGSAFVVVLETQSHAEALVADLDGVVRGIEERGDGWWAVTLKSSADQKVVVRVLDAVRRVLGPHVSSAATVVLDGREYVMNGG